MRVIKRLLAALIAGCFALGLTLAAVTVTEHEVNAASVTPSEVPSMRRSYRDASCVVLATCLSSYKTPGGSENSLFKVDTVYDGDLSEGKLINISAYAVEGQSYLLYLREGGGANYAEDEASFSSVTEGLIPVRDGVAELGGTEYSLSSIIADLEEQRSVIWVPAQSYYYNNAEELISACDDIVICRVTAVTSPTPMLCRSEERGESVTSTIEQTFVTLKVENSFGGIYSYGDKLTVALAPTHAQSVINATDLAAVSFDASPDMPKAGQEYVFFLLRSADAKSELHFAVNPYQGFIRLNGDALGVRGYNTALAGYPTLGSFAELINEIKGF